MISNNQYLKPISSILLAEDNLEHCFFFKKALQQVAPEVKFSTVHDGDALMQLLERFVPDLLFLDLTMPCKNGMECIKKIRDDKTYDVLPIIVFSMSKQANAIQAAFGFGANLYVVKPSDLASLTGSLQKILSMDWRDPEEIAEKYFQGNKYIAFDVA